MNSAKEEVKVLLIDDDPFLLEMYEKKYKEAGCTTVTFADADGEIVQRVLDVNPDVIVLDIIMPGRIGWEALTLLKKDDRTKDIPVFMASNQGQKEDIEKSLELGAVDHFVIAYYTPRSLIKVVLGYVKNPAKYTQVAFTQRAPAQQPLQSNRNYFGWKPVSSFLILAAILLLSKSEDEALGAIVIIGLIVGIVIIIREYVKSRKQQNGNAKLFVRKTKGGIATDGTVTLDRNGLGGLMPTKRNRDIFDHVLAQHEKDTAKINGVLGDGVLAQLLWAFGADPRNENVFYTSQEHATLMVRVGRFLDQLDKEYLAEKQT